MEPLAEMCFGELTRRSDELTELLQNVDALEKEMLSTERTISTLRELIELYEGEVSG